MSHGDVCQMKMQNAAESAKTFHEDEVWGRAWDGVTGKDLDPSFVRQARLEEMAHFKKQRVYTKVPISECTTETGKPIGVRLVDVNKQDDVNPK